MVNHLRDAERLYNTREYPSAVTAMRKALEVIRDLTPNMPSEKQIVNSGKAEDRPAAERWAMLYHAALRLAHMGPHADPISASVTWRREDVQTLLALGNGIAAQIGGNAWHTFPSASTQP